MIVQKLEEALPYGDCLLKIKTNKQANKQTNKQKTLQLYPTWFQKKFKQIKNQSDREISVCLSSIRDNVINAKFLHSSNILRINIVSQLGGKKFKNRGVKVS